LVTSNAPLDGRQHQHLSGEPSLDGPAPQIAIEVFRGAVIAVDRQKLGFQAPAKNGERPLPDVAGRFDVVTSLNSGLPNDQSIRHGEKASQQARHKMAPTRDSGRIA
jgi:hypothetical protein